MTDESNDETTLRVRFARKPCDLVEVLRPSDPDSTPFRVRIELTRAMTDAEYDAFAATLLDDRDWLRGRGGFIGATTRSVVAVSAPNRITLYVDPSGYAYGRYVGIAMG